MSNSNSSSAVNRWNRAVHEAALARPLAPTPLAYESDEEIDRQLLAAGFDLDEIDRKADATYERAVARFGGGEPRVAAPAAADEDDQPAAWVAPSSPDVAKVTSLVTPLRRRRPLTAFAYAAIAAAAAGGTAYLATRPPREEPKKEDPKKEEEPPLVTKPDAKVVGPVESTSAAPAPPEPPKGPKRR